MLAPVPGLVQVSFHLQVRKADLALVSMKELDIMMKIMDHVQSHIIDKGYLVRTSLITSGVMMPTNA